VRLQSNAIRGVLITQITSSKGNISCWSHG
jgi:hypothetical protein